MADDENEGKPTSVVFDHCKAVYEEMSNQARDENDVGLVYEGHLTKLFQQLGLSTPYYTAVMKHLKIMGCTVQLRRGGGNSPSRWLLQQPPDEEAFKSFELVNRARTGKTAVLEQKVRDLVKRIQELERSAKQQESNYRSLNNAFVSLNSKIMEMHDEWQQTEVKV